MAKSCPVPRNPVFTRSGDSVFENVTIWGKLCADNVSLPGATEIENLIVKDSSTFFGDANFKEDVTIDGTLTASIIDTDFLTVFKRFNVGTGGTLFNADTRSDRVGIATTEPIEKFQINSVEDETFIVTETGIVAIGKTNPESNISGIDTAGQGQLKLDIDGSVSISRNIYDSVGDPGVNGAFLNRDENGIRWVTFEPAFSEGVFVQDEGVYIPLAGAAQSFTVFNFVQINSLGVGTDSIIPIPDPSNPIEIVRIQSQDFWGATASGDIYRMTNVGINNNNPAFALDVNGTLNVDNATTLNSTLDVDGETTLNSTLDVDGETTLNSTLDVDGATTLNNTLDVDGETTLNNTLDVDGDTTFNSTTEATSTTSASVQIDGGVGIVKKLFVGGDTKIEGTLELDNSLIDINQQTGVAGKDYRLSSVGTGVSWRPSGVETQNTIWVSKDGDDANSGLLEGDAKATVGGAAAVAQPGDTIKIRPGRYIENNPVGLQRDVSITGEDIRLVTIEPSNPNLDVFWVRRGCLIENLNFAGATIGVSHAGGAAVAFPVTGETANSGYTAGGPADEGPTERWRSPYIRNCTNFMTESIGMRIDGNDATSLSDPGADLKSMVCDSFTQYNENGIGVSITNNAYAQLVSIFTINCDKAIYVDTGGQCDLTNSNSSFGNFGLYAVGLGATEYTGLVNVNVIPGDNSDVIVGKGVTDSSGSPRRPFDGQALYFKIDLNNYPDAVGSGRITAPLEEVSRITVINGGSPGQFSQASPPNVIIRDSDGTVAPKGPQGIIAEASATVNENGQITEIDVINSGRNYLPTQNMVVDINGNTTYATVTMEPIYFTVSEATENTVGITTITFNEFVPYELFEDDPFALQRISRILTSSHSFEYVGSGTSINTSLPFQGALPIKENEVVALNGAQIPFTSTDQKGNFDIGEGIQIDQTTSTIRGRDFSKAIQAEVTPLILALR
jgi:cytoskeletal protein CcmA (bactofilin family)